MMIRITNCWGAFLGLCLLVLLTEGCSQQAKDQEIKADVVLKAKDDVNFAGVQFFVKNGLVRLVGRCSTPKSRELIKQKLSTIHVIDSLEDQLIIAPVTIGPSFALKQQVDSVLAKYPTVMAAVSDTSVVLTGEIEQSALPKLITVVKKVHPIVNTANLITISL